MEIINLTQIHLNTVHADTAFARTTIFKIKHVNTPSSRKNIFVYIISKNIKMKYSQYINIYLKRSFERPLKVHWTSHKILKCDQIENIYKVHLRSRKFNTSLYNWYPINFDARSISTELLLTRWKTRLYVT